MNSRFSPVAIALLVMGIFMLVGFAPLGIAMIIIAAVAQSNRHCIAVERSKAQGVKDRDRREAQLVAATRRFR